MKPKYQNVQDYYECQLVALWNAARFWGFSVPERGSQQYEDAVTDAGGRYGAVIRINPERKRLGLVFRHGERSLRWVRSHLPCHLALFCHRGYHSVAVVAVQRNVLTLANYARGRLHRIPWYKLRKMIHSQDYMGPMPFQYVRRT